MLSRHDRKVVERDRDLPSLALLLDGDRFGDWVVERPGAPPVTGVRCCYLRYKPGVRILARYQVTFGDGSSGIAHAWGVGDRARDKVAKAAALSPVDSPGPASRLVSEAEGVVVDFFPVDRRIPALLDMADPARRNRLLSRRSPRNTDEFWSDFQLHSYKPERRFVGTLTDRAGRKLVVRGYAGGQFRTALRGTRAFSSGQTFRIPRLRGRSRKHRLLLTEWMPGRPLDAAAWVEMDGGSRERLAHGIGQGLAELHAQVASPLRKRTPERESQGLRATARSVQAVLPKAGRHARKLSRRLKIRLQHAAREGLDHVPLHGDFHSGQLLMDERAIHRHIALVDMDRAGFGDPLRDLATFVSHLEEDALGGRIPWEAVAEVEAALIEGYERSSHGICRRRYALQRSIALLRLAPKPFRLREKNWPTLTSSLVQRAESMLESPTSSTPQPQPGIPA